MKRFFKIMCWFTLVFGMTKIAFAIYGLTNSSFIASKIMQGVGAESAMNSVVLSNNLGKTTLPYSWGLLITSILLVMSALVMNKGRRWGFYLYCATQLFLATYFFYTSFNYFPVLVYMSPLPLIGMLIYTAMLENFWFNNKA